MEREPEELCKDCGCPEDLCECEVIDEHCPDCGSHGMVCTCYDDFEGDWDEELDEDEDDFEEDEYDLPDVLEDDIFLEEENDEW